MEIMNWLWFFYIKCYHLHCSPLPPGYLSILNTYPFISEAPIPSIQKPRFLITRRSESMYKILKLQQLSLIWPLLVTAHAKQFLQRIRTCCSTRMISALYKLRNWSRSTMTKERFRDICPFQNVPISGWIIRVKIIIIYHHFLYQRGLIWLLEYHFALQKN